MKILFLLIFATISASTDKVKHEISPPENLSNTTESILKTYEPTTKIDETTLKTANSDSSTESASNFENSTKKNKVVIENTTNSPENISSDGETTNFESTTEDYISTIQLNILTTTSPNVEPSNVTNKTKLEVKSEVIENSANSSDTKNSTKIESTTEVNISSTESTTKNIPTTSPNIQTNSVTDKTTVDENKNFIVNAANSSETKNISSDEETPNFESTTKDYVSTIQMNIITTSPNIDINNVINKEEVIENSTNSFETKNSTKIKSTTEVNISTTEFTTEDINIPKTSPNIQTNNVTDKTKVGENKNFIGNTANSPETKDDSTTEKTIKFYSAIDKNVSTTNEKATEIESTTKVYISPTNEINSTSIPNIQSKSITNKKKFQKSEKLITNGTKFLEHNSDYQDEKTTNIESPAYSSKNIQSGNMTQKNILNVHADAENITNLPDTKTDFETTINTKTSTKKSISTETDSSTNLPILSKSAKTRKFTADYYVPTTEKNLPTSIKPTESIPEDTTTQNFYGNHMVQVLRKNSSGNNTSFSEQSSNNNLQILHQNLLSSEITTVSSSTSSTTFYEDPLTSTENTETSTEETSETSTDGPTETSTAGPPETSTDGPTETSTDGPTETSTDGPTETSTDGPPETSTDGPSETSTDGTSETSENWTSTITDTTTEETTITTTTTTTSTMPPTTINPCSAEGIKVEDVNVISSAPFTLYLIWSDPMPGCNFTYEIKWESKSENRHPHYSVAKTNHTEYKICDLNACDNYTINISVQYSNNSVNSPTEIVGRTSEHMLPVEDITSAISGFKENTNLTLSWTLPRLVQKCLKNYIIQTYKDGKHETTFDRTTNSITFFFIDFCINNTYLISSHSKTINANPKSITYLEPQVNDPPIYNLKETEIYDDFVITKWNFGAFICRPETFKVECTTNNEKPEQVKYITGEVHLQNNSLTAKIENVEPHTNYSCCGIISNMKGDSKCSAPGVFLTNSKAPEKPMYLNISQTENSLEIQWDQPNKWNGVEEGYNITIEFVGFNYNLSENCPEEDTFAPVTKELSNASYTFDIIIPASKYKISVQAKSDGGWSESAIQEVNISEAMPEAPTGLNAKIIQSPSKDYSAFFNLTWNTLCKTYGELNRYYLEVLEQKGNNDKLVLIEDKNLHPKDDLFYTSSSYLKPEYKYTIQLRAYNNEHVGKLAKTTFSAPAGIPIPPNIDQLKRPNASAAREPWNSAVVYISKKIFDETNGEIKYVSIIVAEPGCEETRKDDYYEDWPKVTSDNSNCVNELRAYEATDPKWNPFLQRTNCTFSASGECKYMLGANQSCGTVLDCNRPLKPSTTYYIKLRLFSTRGYRDTPYLTLTTEAFNDVPVGLIVGLIIGILAIAFIIAAVLFYTKGKLNFKNWPRIESANQISPAPLPVPIKKFGSHYEKMIENPGKIKNEFQLLSTISSDVTLSTKTALLPLNKKKNRYINILPYDQTRVHLSDTNENSSDYINASYIKGYSGSNEYIATQGPTEATCPAFWQMIVEQNVKLIVMLTQFVESGKDKCYKYFPELKDEYDYLNDIKVQCIEEEIMNVYNKRVFKVKKGNITRKVTHMQFNLWPDFGVPDEVHYMLDFCETIKEIKLKKPSIIVMHCSAGVGRTGTLIAVDILLQNIRDKRKVDIFGTVLNLRKQRMNMVQSERQYEFLYKCLYHVITNKISNTSSKHNLNQICESNML